jgi:hypothetical protein
MSVLKGEHAWLEHGIAAENSEMGIDFPVGAASSAISVESQEMAGV